MTTKKTIWKWFFRITWALTGLGVVFLLVAAVHKKDHKACKAVDISIVADGDNFFVDQKDVLQAIRKVAGGDPVGKPCGDLNLRQIETGLEENVWIKSAELFFDNNNILKAKVIERVPVARVFTTTGTTFYLDTAAARLPLSDKFSARVPVFTGFPSDRIVFAAEDSMLMRNVVNISRGIIKDSFLFSMIDQVDITPDRRFEMVPRIGNSIIIFGDASDIEARFRKLKTFYRQVIPKTGWGYYSSINLQYKGQVVASKRGAAEIKADSLKVIQLMQEIARQAAEQQAADTVQRFVQDNAANTADSTIIQQSLQRDEEPGRTPAPVINNPVPAAAPATIPSGGNPVKPITPPARNTTPVVRAQPGAATPVRTVPAKPAAKPPAKPGAKPPAQKPRVVMPPKNDY